MTLKELYEQKYKNVPYIGFLEYDENGKIKKIYPDYADEILETHGERVVKNEYYSKAKHVLVVELKEDTTCLL